MKVLLLFGFFLVLKICSTKCLAADDSLTGGGDINMINLGNVDGKSYFLDDTASLTWFQSRDICREYGMELATITTDSQFAFLKSKYNSTTFGKIYWIGARDSKQTTALSWDSTDVGIGPLPSAVEWHYATPQFQLCGMYQNSNGKQQIWGYECTRQSSNVGTLCET